MGRIACKDIADADLASIHEFGERHITEALAIDTSNYTQWPHIGVFIGLRRMDDVRLRFFALQFTEGDNDYAIAYSFGYF